MLDAMRSLLNTSIDQFRAPQVQAEALQRARSKPEAEKTYSPNPAVEVTLSPQAQAILKALEANDITTEQLQEAQSANEETARQRQNPQEAGSIALPDQSAQPSLRDEINRILEENGLPGFSEEDNERLNLLFREIQISLQPAEGADAGTPVSANGGVLSSEEQMKVSALYAELDRLLGSAGVFFGGNQLIQKLSAENQAKAKELKAELDSTLSPHAGPDFPQGLTPPQEARIDAILREIAQVYDRANDQRSDVRKEALRKAFGGSAAPAQTGGASLDA